MKKTLLPALLATILCTACDPGYSFDFAIKNKSQHAFTLQSLQDTTETHWQYRAIDMPANTTDTVFSSVGMGYADIPDISEDIRRELYGDSVQILFDDGKSLKFYLNSDTAGGLYCFADTNYPGSRYLYEPQMNTHFFKGEPGYCKYTLIITDADYQQATP